MCSIAIPKRSDHKVLHLASCPFGTQCTLAYRPDKPRCRIVRPEVMPHTAFHSYSQFRNATLTCDNCNWSGQGRETDVGDVYEQDKVSEYHCPHCKHADHLAVAPWPRLGECRA